MRYSRYDFNARDGKMVDLSYSCYSHDEATGKFTYIRLPWTMPVDANTHIGGKFSSKPIDDPAWYWTVVKKSEGSTWYVEHLSYQEDEIAYNTVFIPETHPLYNAYMVWQRRWTPGQITKVFGLIETGNVMSIRSDVESVLSNAYDQEVGLL